MIFQIVILILALGMVSPHGPVDVGHDLDWVYVLFIGIQGGAQVTMVGLLPYPSLPLCRTTSNCSCTRSDSLSGMNVETRNNTIAPITHRQPLCASLPLNGTTQLTSRLPIRALASCLQQ